MGSFTLKTKILFGETDIAEVFQGKSRVLIVTDKFMHESGKVSYLTDPFDAAGIAYEIFSDVAADPDVTMVTKGVTAMLNFEPQAVAALGGGSAIDAAKAIVYFSTKQTNGEKCMFAAIPTTSGTGSEVSKFAVITDREKEVKYPLIDDSLLPDVAILDAELVKTVPPAITADTGIDVLTHAVEAFVSTNANDFTNAAAEKAIKLVRSNLLKVYENPDCLKLRQEMHNASCLAGMAFSEAGLGLNHGMAHTLGAHFHIPHGRANGILMPYVMGFNAGCFEGKLTDTAKKYAQISRLLRIDGPSVRQSAFSLVRTAKQYLRKLNIPDTIEAAGVSREDFEAALDEMAEAAFNDRCTQTNPRPCTVEEIKQLFRRAYSGRL